MQLAAKCLEGSGKCEVTPTASYLADGDETEQEEVPGPRVLYWPDLKSLLSDKLSKRRLEENLR